jgi:hypothetical protein
MGMSKPDEQQIIDDLKQRFEQIKARHEAMKQIFTERDRELNPFISPSRSLAVKRD